MATKNDQTASFVLRFTQKIYEDNDGESNVQWRGKVSHVQGSDESNFTDLEDALKFIQAKLSALTKSAVKGKSKAEKEGILSKSFDLWKKTAKVYPKLVLNAIKDPKAQVAQIQEQISHVGDEISQKIEIDSWRMASKSDYQKMMKVMESMSDQIQKLDKKVDKISKQNKKKA